MLSRGKRKVVIQSVDDDGFPENLAPAKQKMVKRGENTSIWVKTQKFQKTIFRQNPSQFCKRSSKKVGK